MQTVCALANHMFRGRYLLTTPHQQIYTIWDWEMIISVFEYTCLEFQKVGSDFFNTCAGNAGIENRVSTVASRRKVRKNWLLFGVSTSELSSTWMNYVGQQFSLVGDSLEGNEVYHICCSLFPVNSKELHLSTAEKSYPGKTDYVHHRMLATGWALLLMMMMIDDHWDGEKLFLALQKDWKKSRHGRIAKQENTRLCINDWG